MWSFYASDNRLPTKGMKYRKLPSGSDRKSTHLHVAKTPGPVNDQEFFDEVSGGEWKQSVNPQDYSMFLNSREKSVNVIQKQAKMTNRSLFQVDQVVSP